MNEREAAVYCDRADVVSRLGTACPSWTFVQQEPARSACALAICDGSESHPDTNAMIRLLLCDGAGERGESEREVRVPLDEFLRAPDTFLAFAGQLVDKAQELARVAEEITSLRQIHELMAMVDAEQVSERITSTVLEFLGLPHATLFLHDPRLERYVVSFSSDPAERESADFLPGVPPEVLQQALASPESFAAARRADGAGLIVIPLQVRDDLLAVIKVPLHPGDVIPADAGARITKYLAAVTGVLSNIYQLTRSQELAMRDDLTKAYNRRFFETYLDEEIERSRRYGTLFSIIFLDLDDLKMVNNLYGHLSGSRTLQEVAKRILGAVRGIDKVVRFGGDEFCVILPQTDQEQAVAVANRISRSISASQLRIDANIEVSITASFGIATYPTHAITKDELIRQADAAMYRVKATTKNAVGLAVVANATKPV